LILLIWRKIEVGIISYFIDIINMAENRGWYNKFFIDIIKKRVF